MQRMKVSDYLSEFLVSHGLQNLFCVVGGLAMHMNRSFGLNRALHVVYNHNEQASAIAAEAYARVTGDPGVLCVTGGPGASNAITGVLCAWMGSTPMIIFSGQARYATTAAASGLALRTRGEQEVDIAAVVAPITKYAVMVKDASSIRYHLEKAVFLASHGRPGPVWLDLPLDVQTAEIVPEALVGFDPEECRGELPPKVDCGTCARILEKLRNAQRPVLYAGNGIRIARAQSLFLKLVEKLGIPVTTGMSSVDLIPSDHRLFAGRCGVTGDRAGNFAVQNSDVLLSLGSRLSFKQTGFNYESWARGAYLIMNDIDRLELKKDSLKVDLPVWADARELIESLLSLLEEPLPVHAEWVRRCRAWREKYPVVCPEQELYSEPCNVYSALDRISRMLPERQITVVSAGSARVVSTQTFTIKREQRFIVNPAIAAMGYDLPAAIAASIAEPEKDVLCITGDGSLQMNLQELQTIVQNRLPVKIIVINNSGYHSIRQTQSNFSFSHLVGVGPESGDLSFPDLSRLIPAYGIPYCACRNSGEIDETAAKFLALPGAAVMELFVTIDQRTEPKSATKCLKDGRLVSTPLEDMAPFLPREELKENMSIPCWREEE